MENRLDRPAPGGVGGRQQIHPAVAVQVGLPEVDARLPRHAVGPADPQTVQRLLDKRNSAQGQGKQHGHAFRFLRENNAMPAAANTMNEISETPTA